MNDENPYDDVKFAKLVAKVEEMAADLNCSYAIPINELEDGTSDVYGIIIGDITFIQAIMSTLNIQNVDAKEVPKSKPKRSNDDDPTFH